VGWGPPRRPPARRAGRCRWRTRGRTQARLGRRLVRGRLCAAADRQRGRRSRGVASAGGAAVGGGAVNARGGRWGRRGCWRPGGRAPRRSYGSTEEHAGRAGHGVARGARWWGLAGWRGARWRGWGGGAIPGTPARRRPQGCGSPCNSPSGRAAAGPAETGMERQGGRRRRGVWRPGAGARQTRSWGWRRWWSPG